MEVVHIANSYNLLKEAPVRVELTKQVLQTSIRPPDFGAYNMELMVIETISNGCKPNILAFKLQPHNMCVSPSWIVVRLLSIGVNPLAVVTRDASNPSTGLFAKQQVVPRAGVGPANSAF